MSTIYSPHVLALSVKSPQVAAGYFHEVALKNDGTVWTWGLNNFGQLGLTGLSASSIPTQVQGVSDMRAIAAGFFHTVALRSDGTVWAWGDNSFGQLGISPAAITSSSAALRVPGLENVVAIAASGAHTLALTDDGTVWAWGWNAYGQLGIGNKIDMPVPTPVPKLHQVRSVAAGFFHSLALGTDGTAWAWGYNGHGQLGNDTLDESDVPSHVQGIAGVTALVGGGGHTLALRSDGSVWAWGLNNYGQLGNDTVASSSVPLRVSDLRGGREVAAGFFHSMAITNSGVVMAWGHNGLGQLGNDGYADSSTPREVVRLKDAINVSANNNHALTLNNDGTVTQWGGDEILMLGGSDLSAAVPIAVRGPDSQGALNLGVTSFQDIWNDPNQPGWGVWITQHGTTLFSSWHTYDADGSSIWLVIPGGTWTDLTTFVGTLYRTYGQPTGVSFVSGKVDQVAVGTAEFHFVDAQHATLSFHFLGTSGQRNLTRFRFDTTGMTPDIDYSDIWWAPAEPGSGLIIRQQSKTIFANWHTYDPDGRAIRYLLPGGQWINSYTFSGTLYRNQSTSTGVSLNQGIVTQTPVGTATLSFSSASNMLLQYTVEGISGTKVLTRLPF